MLHLLAILTLALSLGAIAQPTTQPINVMSFNIRYGTAPDGDNHWDKRKTLLVATIRKNSPDLLGTQECIAEQFEFLKACFPEYTAIGAGRNDGKLDGEFSAIFIRSDRFEVLDSGTFWLSETPDKVGSIGWDASMTRVATWAKLRDRSSARDFIFLNTHFDHIGEKARTESARLIATFLKDKHPLPAIVTGDFNAHDKSLAYQALVGEKSPARLTDSYRALHEDSPDEATFHAFSGVTKGERIDYVLCSDVFAPSAAAIERTHANRLFPSDHFPVTAEIIWR
jgi:endonuclease/exonuclease/phosphatase family metal-dependent hydrolase